MCLAYAGVASQSLGSSGPGEVIAGTIPISSSSEAGDLVQGHMASMGQSQDLNPDPCDLTSPNVLTGINILVSESGEV